MAMIDGEINLAPFLTLQEQRRPWPGAMSWLLLGLSAFLMLGVQYQAHSTTQQFSLTKVADVATGYGTFQSHNQKIVQNAYGLFMTYLYSRDVSSKGTWRLARSLDGGTTWGTIWIGTASASPPILETDAHGSIYLIHSDDAHQGWQTLAVNQNDGNATFYRFDPEKSFTNPIVTLIPRGSASKFASVWDEAQQRLYYMTFWSIPDIDGVPIPNFFALSRDGIVLSRKQLTQIPNGAISNLQYPHLEIDGTTLYVAWTTNLLAAAPYERHYRAILYIFSEDGGETWHAPGGIDALNRPIKVELNIPIVGDETGPAQMVNEGKGEDVACYGTTNSPPTTPDCYSNWLWSFVSKGGFLHFAYRHESSPAIQHYMRFSPTSGIRDINTTSWQANDGPTTLFSPSGFFATDPAASTPLFSVAQSSAGNLAVLSSSDLGASWQEHAVSDVVAPLGYEWYAISGNRRLTKTGDIIGHVTATPFSQTPTPPAVYFFRVPAVDRSNDPSTEAQGLRFYGVIGPDSIKDYQGYAYKVTQFFGTEGDSSIDPTKSQLLLFEDGIPIKPLQFQPAHDDYTTLGITTGNGNYRLWGNTLYLTASDNTDPRTNGRTYSFATAGGAAPVVGEDFSISLSDSPDPAPLGNNIIYTLTVTNTGPVTASAVVTDNLGGAMFALNGSTLNCSGSGARKICPGGDLATCRDPYPDTSECSDTNLTDCFASGPVMCGVDGLASGASATLTVAAKPAATGMITNTASVYPGNSNATTTTTVSLMADLSEAALTVTMSGANLLINDRVQNTGAGSAGAFNISYYLSANMTYETTDTYLCGRGVGSLPAGASNPASGTTQSTCAIPSVAGGNYYLIARVDSGGSVTESNESNNTGNVAVTITGKDLLPSAMSAARVSGSTTKVTVSETVKNQGNQNAGKFVIQYYLSTDSTYQSSTDIALVSSQGGKTACSRSLSALNAGLSSTVTGKTCYKPNGAVTGVTYNVLVVDDRGSAVIEYNENNNVGVAVGTVKW